LNDKTQPIHSSEQSDPHQSVPGVTQDQPHEKTQPLHRRGITKTQRIILWIILIISASLTLIALAGFLGVKQGETLRYVLATAQVGEAAFEQFNLAMEDYEAGRYEMAVQRFEYILELEPEFPGVAEKIDEILAFLNRPTRTPSPTLLTPTGCNRYPRYPARI